MLRAVLAAALLLGGCVSPVAQVQQVLDRRVRGGPEHAFVPGYPSSLDALPFAAAHCARFDKATRFRRIENGGALFDCVPK
jgi:hypothetical protein